MGNFTDRVLQFALDTHLADIPIDAVHQTKRCLLDTLGALLAGTDTPVARLLTSFATRYFKGDEATILVSGERVSAPGAALANGFAANALDIDDGHRLVKGHPGACVLPVVLAASETAPSTSGADFLAALVVGYEVGIRAGLIRHAVYQKFHSSGSWGAIGGAAAAGKVLGLKHDTLSQAMGVAEYHAPIAPMMKCIENPSMVKDSIGWGCMVAVLSVLMSREGFTGINPLFDDTPNRKWIENLGKHYEIMNLYFKPYAACRWAHPAVYGALKLCREHEIGPEEISRIQVRTFQGAKELSRQPPADTEEAQYNMAFPVAAALVEGEVGPRQVLPPGIYDRRILDLAQKVEAETEPQFEAVFPAKACAEVIILTTNGKRLSSGRVEAQWEPPDTLPTDAELEDKFVWLVEPVLGEDRTRQLLTTVWNFESIDNLGEFISSCIK